MCPQPAGQDPRPTPRPWRARSSDLQHPDCRPHEHRSYAPKPARLDPFEIGTLRDREVLKMAAQAVKTEFDGAETDPVAATIDARAAGFGALVRGDREVDAAAKVDAVGAIVDLDQYRKRMTGTSLTADGLRHFFGRLTAHFA